MKATQTMQIWAHNELKVNLKITKNSQRKFSGILGYEQISNPRQKIKPSDDLQNKKKRIQ